MGHKYVVDTSALIKNPNLLSELSGEILIPIEVIKELDNHKTRQDKVGMAARKTVRFLAELLDKYPDLSKGALTADALIKIVSNENKSGLSNDDMILTAAILEKELGNDPELLSADLALRIKASSNGILSSDDENGVSKDDFYLGVRRVEVDYEDIQAFYEDGYIYLDGFDFNSNEGVLMVSEFGTALGIAKDSAMVEKMKFASKKDFAVNGIKPNSKEQSVALDLLLNETISLITLNGMAGCGKTLLAIAAAFHLQHTKQYKKIIISRPAQSMSKDIGFLPGTKDEKMKPWLQPIFDNIEAIFSKKAEHYISSMQEKGTLEIEALSHIRGRTLPDTIFIVDEAQNITYHEAKAVLTRMGKNSKLILIGDIEQIDSPSLNEKTSGLAHVIELFKAFNGAGHVTLIKGERSELATFAAKVM